MKTLVSKCSSLFVLLLCCSFYCTAQSSTQNNSVIQEIKLNAKNYNSNTAHFKDLAFKLHPTTYVDNQKINKILEPELASRKLVINDYKSLQALERLNFNSEQIELIYITLNTAKELSALASLSNLSSYKNLKYIFIKCCFNSNPSEILKFVTIDSNNIRVFYKTEIPS
jgi:hypothetical protein